MNCFLTKNAHAIKTMMLLLGLVFICSHANASTLNLGGATGGDEFKGLYDWIYAAGTGYLGRSICIIGGIVGLIMAAGSGKVMLAMLPAGLAIFGVFGPVIVNAMFSSALI